MKEERFDALVASIYEAGSGRVPWRDPLDALAGAFDSPRSILTGILTPALRPAFRDEGGRCDPGLICEALHGNHADDPALARLLVAPPGRWLFEEDVPPSDGTPPTPLPLAPTGLGFAAGVLLEGGPLAVVLALTRGRRRPSFDAGRRESLARLAFHFQAALAIEARRSSPPLDEAPGLDGMARDRHPLWLVDGHRRIHLRNAAAEMLRDRADRVVETEARLHCVDPLEDTELACALASLELGRRRTAGESAPRRAVMRIGGTGPGAHAVLLTERSRPDEQAPPLAVIRCYSLQHDAEPDPALVAEAFELTPAEARVAAQLARGLSAMEIAALRGVSMQTIRAQIRAVFEKTGINRQSDLVRLLVEMPNADRIAASSGPRPTDEDPATGGRIHDIDDPRDA